MKKMILKLQKIEDFILISCLIVMGMILLLQIIMRFVFSSPLKWVEELARYLQIWIAFLGIGYGVRNNSHISMTSFVDKMPLKIRSIVEILCNLVSTVSFAVVIYASATFLKYQNKVSPVLEIPMRLVYIVIPIGSIIFLLYNLAELNGLVKSILKIKERET